MELATKKQIDFINAICERLGIERPTNLTKLQATQWISEHIDDYENAVEDFGLSMFDTF